MNANSPLEASIAAAIAARAIENLVHFTTNHGLVGILASHALQARSQLAVDEYLEHIYRPNAAFRREPSRYWDYVNLSITDVNSRFFDISQRWHPTRDNLFWVILHLEPAVMTHSGVLFAPGNMAYDGIVPAGGAEAFDALFDSAVPYGYGKRVARPPTRAANLPTNPQAEVLYPQRIDTRYLRTITVATDEDAADVEGIVGSVGHAAVEVVVDRDRFRVEE